MRAAQGDLDFTVKQLLDELCRPHVYQYKWPSEVTTRAPSWPPGSPRWLALGGVGLRWTVTDLLRTGCGLENCDGSYDVSAARELPRL